MFTFSAVEKLMDLKPPTAVVLRNGQEREVPVEQVHPGDRVVVYPGADHSLQA